MTSPIRPDNIAKRLIIVSRVVKNGSTITANRAVKAGSTVHEVDASAGANDAITGIALETLTGDGVKTAQIALLNGGGVVPVIVGTGGATEHAYAVSATDGMTDKTLGGGTTVAHVAGRFTQTGVAGDLVGLAVGQFDGVSA